MTVAHTHSDACDATHPTSTRRLATRAGAVGLVAGLTALCAVVLVRNPLENMVFPPCPLHATTGLWCPACGATRASYLLLKGDVAGAVHYNVLWVVLAPFVVYQVVAFVAEAFGVGWLRRISLNRFAIAGLLASMMVFFVVRNLPFAAFEVLNPLAAS